MGKAYRYDEELVVPIIENTPFEEDLKDELDKTILAYPETCAVLVRRHGVYVWGDTWQQAKTMYVLILTCLFYFCSLNIFCLGRNVMIIYLT